MTANNVMQYQVLARKYRPQQFNQLIGQDVLVRVITNAIKFNRLPHAFMLTGVRGVGKTTTARIIARMLNCVGLDGHGAETIEPCGQCPQCQAIAEDRHLDVIEMDAASRTGIDDIRDIIDAAHYKSVFGRYKVYIIDEVHMLSKNAFNALLKTLEEPPEHIKFIFATTELKKVPDTVLSRCAHFELKRLTDGDLQQLFQHVLAQENITIEPGASQLLARAAQGSARDGLSLLDQALNIDRHNITEQGVRSMLNIMDRSALISLMHHLLTGQSQYCLQFVQDYYQQGNDPGNLIAELLDMCHYLSLLKTHAQSVDNTLLSTHEIELGTKLAVEANLPILMRFWQVLLKGYDEIARAPSRFQATQMIFMRLCFMAHLPTPQQTLEYLTNGSAAGSQPIQLETQSQAVMHSHKHITNTTVPSKKNGSNIAQSSQTTIGMKLDKTVPMPTSFREMTNMINQHKEALLFAGLNHDVHLIDYQPGHIKMRLSHHASSNFVINLKKVLERLTGVKWVIEVNDVGGAATVKEQTQTRAEATLNEVKKNSLVIDALTQFPDAVIGQIEESNDS